MFELKQDGLCFVMLWLLSCMQETLKFYSILFIRSVFEKKIQKIVEKGNRKCNTFPER